MNVGTTTKRDLIRSLFGLNIYLWAHSRKKKKTRNFLRVSLSRVIFKVIPAYFPKLLDISRTHARTYVKKKIRARS